MNTKPSRWNPIRSSILPLFPVAVGILCATIAGAQAQLGSLTDGQIVEQIHRAEFKAEYDRRMEAYSPEQRRTLAEMRAKMPREHSFPAGYPDEALLDHIEAFDDSAPAWAAIRELAGRYVGKDAARVNALAARFRSRFGRIPYPAMTPENAGAREYHERDNAYRGLSEAVKACLPEPAALDLLWDVYISPKPYRGVSRFLGMVRGAPFNGQATIERLLLLDALLREHYTQEDYRQAAEDPNLLDALRGAIAHCGDAGFETFTAMEWDSAQGIHTMGTLDRPEARAMLVDLYRATPEEQMDRRAAILGALAIHYDQAGSEPGRDLLRVEIPRILLAGSYDRPSILRGLAGTAAKTRDPYFLDALRALQQDLTPARLMAAAPESEQERAALNYRALRGELDRSIDTLERTPPPVRR